MEQWQAGIISLFGLIAAIGTIHSFRQCREKKNSYGLTPFFYVPFGAFVFADMVVFGTFWILASIISLLLQDFILFLLIFSIFWLVRSIGETMYWFHQQFTPNKGNPPEKFWIFRIFRNDSVWFVYQIYWQCLSVITIISSLYMAKLWLEAI